MDRSIITNVLLKYAGMGTSKYLVDPVEVIQKLKSKNILVFDTETTGLYANVHQITEIAAEVINPSGAVIDSFHRKIKLTEKTKSRLLCEKDEPDDKPIFNVKRCLKLQGYNPDDPGLWEEDKALLAFKEFYDKQDALVVGQNATFDLQMVNTRLKMIDRGMELERKEVYDTKNFSGLYVVPMIQAMALKGDLEAQEMQKTLTTKDGKITTSLGPILKAFKIDIKGWHGAPADVKSTVTLLQRTLEFIDRNKELFKDPEFLKERAKRFRKELENKQKNQKTRAEFYKKDQKLFPKETQVTK